MISIALIALFSFTAVATAQPVVPPLPTDNRAAVKTVWPLAWGNQSRVAALETRISAIETTAARLGVTIAAPTPTLVVPTVGVPTDVPTSTAIPTVGVPTAPPGGSTLTPQPTVLVATVAPAATATPAGMAMFGICGESHTTWHPPVITQPYKDAHLELPQLVVGCATKHEHGAPPPPDGWVEAFEQSRGRTLSYFGAHNTSTAENDDGFKHVAMKSYTGFIQTNKGAVEYFAVLHGTEVPFERASQFHSARYWFRYAGKVSHIQFQGDFGNASDNARRFLRGRVPAETDIRGVMLVADAVSAANGAGFGQWYQNPGNPPFGVDYGLTFGNIGTYYQRGEEIGNTFDMSRWIITGGTNNIRRIEFAWYPNRDPRRGAFWTLAIGGASVTGPTDPKCGSAITSLCVEQVIQNDLPEMSFASTGGKNAFQQSYPDTGVVMPN